MHAQNVTISGVVRDSLTREPVPFASVMLVGTERGVLTDDNGKFKIFTALRADSIIASAMGYSTRKAPLRKGASQSVTILLPSTGVILSEVIAKPKKEHYSKKNNPAVDFMQRIRRTADANDPRRHQNYNYGKYERINLAINDYQFNDSAKRGIDKKFAFLKEYVDTAEMTGKPILNVTMREKLSQVHYRNDPSARKEYVFALRSSGLDEMLDRQSTQIFYEDVMREIDVYQDNITILQQRFVSPLSRISPDFYKFYLTDTLMVDSVKCVRLTFAPRNPATFGFTGNFYVPLNDTTMFIKKIDMRTPHDINLNFVTDLFISQEYVKAPDGSRLKVKDEMALEASVIPGMPGMYGRRVTVYDGHDFLPPADEGIFRYPTETIYAAGAEYKDADYWDANRKTDIGHGGRNMEAMMAHLRSVPLFYWGEQVVKVLVSSYIPVGKDPKFAFGPMTSTMSFNDIEGLRLRAGGVTTANLSRRLFLGGYGAYGFKDHRWKYKGEVEWSFGDKDFHSQEFPIHSLKASYLYDLNRLGQMTMIHNADNMFLSLSRLPDRQMTYHRAAKLEYTMENEHHFSVEARLMYERQYSTRFMTFINGYDQSFGHYDLSSLRVSLRWAPGEKFVQTMSRRTVVNFDAPVFTLSHTVAPKGVMGNNFALNVTEASFKKRFWFSAFGYVDLSLKGGHVWSRSPYPNLLMPGANLSYLVIPDLFSCLNPMEFINDSYAQWDFTYWANGTILNYIPLIKRLKLREALIFKGVWGHLSDRNKPWLNPGLYSFPTVSHTQLMTNTPYMELGVGLDNVFKILRFDYTWRLTYRHNPGACRGGLRVTFHLAF